ncbi:MAG: peptide chain release factor 1, partial [Micromonosporaceae bacterium]
ITDHRIGFTAYNLDQVLQGDMDGVLDAISEAERAARLAGETQLSRK